MRERDRGVVPQDPKGMPQRGLILDFKERVCTTEVEKVENRSLFPGNELHDSLKSLRYLGVLFIRQDR